MLRSMTGFGRAQGQAGGMAVTVELKSVNHRYFEFSGRIPRMYGFLEEKLKTFLSGYISRGKVECFVQIDVLDGQEAQVLVNHPLAAGYVKALRELSERYGLREDLSCGSLARFPDVLAVHKGEADEAAVWQAVMPVARQAAESFCGMREAEGEKMKADVEARMALILDKVAFVEERSPETVKEYSAKLAARMQELLSGAQVEEQRLLTEAAIYADKVAVAEETVRLRSHMEQMRTFLNADAAIGRKMDFLVQEMNREANTIGSKSQDVAIARAVVDIKAEVEKIREQIQNIE